MEHIPYSRVRSNFARTMDKVCENRKPIAITRRGSEPVILMSLSDYEGMEETLYLLSSPENARRLNEAIEELESGGGEEHELVPE